MHKCLNEFEFRQDLTTDYRTTCPWVSEKPTNNLVAFLVPLFLVGSSLFLQVTMTTITSRMSLDFRQIQSQTAELAALD